jgi:hypothetical protein
MATIPMINLTYWCQLALVSLDNIVSFANT